LAPTSFICNRTIIEAVPENSTEFDVFFIIETTVLGVSPESFEREIVQDIFKNASAEALGAFVDFSDIDIKCVSEYFGDFQTRAQRRLQTSTFFGAVIVSTVNFDVSSADVDAKTAAEVSQASLLESIESGSFEDLLLSLASSNEVQELQNASTNGDFVRFETVLPPVTSGFEATRNSSAFAYRVGVGLGASVFGLFLIFSVDYYAKRRRSDEQTRTRGSSELGTSRISVRSISMHDPNPDEGITICSSKSEEELWSIENNTPRKGSNGKPSVIIRDLDKELAGGSSERRSTPSSDKVTSYGDRNSRRGFERSGLLSSQREPDAHLQGNTTSSPVREGRSDTWKWTTAARQRVEALRKEGCTAQEAYVIVFGNQEDSEEKEYLHEIDDVASGLSRPRLKPQDTSSRRWSLSSYEEQPKSPTQSSMKGSMQDENEGEVDTTTHECLTEQFDTSTASGKTPERLTRGTSTLAASKKSPHLHQSHRPLTVSAKSLSEMKLDRGDRSTVHPYVQGYMDKYAPSPRTGSRNDEDLKGVSH
jgi:hypothetical protein